MVDLMAGPNAPLTKAFIFCGWRTITVDWLIDASHDLSHPLRQASLHEQLQDAAFLFAVLDCSTKSRAREIPITFSDGRPGPPPLRSKQHPEGLPNLSGRNKERVATDNAACHWVLDEIQALAQRGGGSRQLAPLGVTQGARDDADGALAGHHLFSLLLRRRTSQAPAAPPQYRGDQSVADPALQPCPCP